MPASSLLSEVRNRARGTLLGQAIGDALGTTVEFQDAKPISRQFPGGLRDLIGGGPFHVMPGQITDDTELALALARSIVQQGWYDDHHVAAAYWKWYHSGPFDVGSTTAQAFGAPLEIALELVQQMRSAASRISQANGSLMRQSPLAVSGWRLRPDELADYACRDSTLSHPHPACQESCVAYTHAIALAIRSGAPPREVHGMTIQFMQSRHAAGAAGVLKTLLDAAKAPPADYYDQMGWVLKALQNAFYRLLHAENFEEGIVETVMAGGDTDTNACIAGALLGAVHGASAIPQRWIDTLLSCRSPRPATYHCHDLLDIADRLINCHAAGGSLSSPP